MIPGLGIFRRTITLGLCAASFWAGTQFQSFFDVNRVMDLCVDDASAYFKEHGSFHPDCEALLNGLN